MRIDSVLGSLLFLTGDTPDQNALGAAKYLAVLLYTALLIGGIAVALANLSRDPAHRTGRNAAIWLFRV